MGAPAAEKSPSAAGNEGSASLLTGGSPSSKLVDKAITRGAKAKPKASLAKVAIRAPKASWQGDLRDINLTALSMLIDFTDTKPPTLLDQVVVDIVPKHDLEAIARINTVVTAIGLSEKTLECRSAHVSVQIVDDDQDKLATLSKFIAEVRR
jgi:hypothetical protein